MDNGSFMLGSNSSGSVYKLLDLLITYPFFDAL